MTNCDIKVACMSLMWGKGRLPTESVPAWLDDVVAAGYDGAAVFDRELLRFTQEMDFHGLLTEHNLALVSVDYTIDRDSDRLRRVCELMQSLNARHLVTIGGLATRDTDPAEIAPLLNEIGETALVYGVHACYHNHTGNTGETLEETEKLLALTDPAKFFGFLDTGHATKDFVGHSAEKRAAMFLERNWDRIDFLEFKDWAEEHDLCTEVGAGVCDYEAVFRILKEKAYSGWITVEQNGPMGHKTPLECARASRDFIRSGLGV
jgi:sugar phosphate isomerase/epimerase